MWNAFRLLQSRAGGFPLQMGFEVNYAKLMDLGLDYARYPERCRAIQQDIEIAQRLVSMGCKLQASADFIAGGRFGKEKRPALKLLNAGLYDYVASDAHNAGHYHYFKKVCSRYVER